jgi:hypothetical protein
MPSDDRIERGRGTRPRGVAVKAAPRKRAAAIKTPPPVALEYAEDVAGRVSDRPVPVRNGFIERVAVGSVGDPPLATMLRGGQGGAVRLKLLLAMLWFAVRHPHETSYPARGWAGLLGLDEYETNGARRITAAIDWLEARKLVRVVRSPGVPSKVYLRDERAAGDEYVLPFVAVQEKKEEGEELTRDDLYITLPPEFFTKGWIAVLSAPAVAMLLVMVLEARYSRRVDRLWHSPAQAERRFGLSEDTRGAGLAELVLYGIVDKKTAPVSPGVFDMKRRRNIYDLHLEQLLVEPGQPRPDRQITAAELEENAEAAQGDVEVAAEAEGAPELPVGKAPDGKRKVRVKKKALKDASESNTQSPATEPASAG